MSLNYGKPKDWIEDVYTMAGDNSGPQSVANFHGTYMGENNAQYPQEVIISCPNKMGRVRASMGGPITLNVQSQWEPMFGGGIASMTNSILGVANQLVEWGLGCTIQQPWMNRKNYKNTQPFSFTLPLKFVAIESAKDDVVKPCLALVSFLYPRKYDPAHNDNANRYEEYNNQTNPSTAKTMEMIGNSDQTKEGTTAWTEIQSKASNKNALGKVCNWVTKGADNTGIVGATLDMFEVWEIPGPSLLTASEKATHKGDVVDIIVGKMFNLGNCYLESANISFSSSFDIHGYPLAATAEIKCTCADSVVCSSSGNLLVNQVFDQSAKLENFVNACSDTVTNLADNLMNLFKMYKGYYSGTFKVQEKTAQ